MHICCKVLFISFLFSACSVKPAPKDYIENRVEQLTSLLSFFPSVDQKEAKDLARNSIFFSYSLAKKYKVKSPPLWQNTLVNLGFKKRGLCYHWADDLWHYLHTKKYKTLKFYYITANRGKLTEHNALSVGVKGLPLKKTIVLDAWRNSGQLYFIELGLDKNYVWKERKVKNITTLKDGKY